MLKLSSGWLADVERGPDWLFVRLKKTARDTLANGMLADSLTALMEQNFAHRLVVELDDLASLPSNTVGQLATLYKRISADGGLMRVCGATGSVRETLKSAQLDTCFPEYATRKEAVMGYRPGQPR